MEKSELLASLAAAKGQAGQSKVNVDAQKAVITTLIAMGKDPAAAALVPLFLPFLRIGFPGSRTL